MANVCHLMAPVAAVLPSSGPVIDPEEPEDIKEVRLTYWACMRTRTPNMYAHILSRTHTHTHTYTHEYLHACMYAHTNVHNLAQTQIYVAVSDGCAQPMTYMWVRPYTATCVHAWLYLPFLAFIMQLCLYINVHAHAHAHLHAHTCFIVYLPSPRSFAGGCTYVSTRLPAHLLGLVPVPDALHKHVDACARLCWYPQGSG